MPYNASNVESLPTYVQKLDAKAREKWVSIWNSAYSNAKSDSKGGGAASDKEAETVAFRIANAAVMGKKAHEAVGTFDGMTAFLAKMRELLKDKVASDDWNTAIITARASAGGKGRAFKLRATCEQHGEADDTTIAACEYCGDYAEPAVASMSMYRLEKADDRVNYTSATELGMTCGDCRFFGGDSCQLVEGFIERNMTCDLFTPYVHSMSENPEQSFSRLFVATRAFAENKAPDWMPYLPTPGIFKHPKWGDVTMSRERLATFVKNFKAKVYQEKLPIDAEHEYKLTGAVGWINDLRQNSDGSVDARVEWTDRGNQLVQAGGYKYVSPEWWDEWIQPETGQSFNDVAIGAAITTRPFFKERSLRPLVANEDRTLTEGDNAMPDPKPETTPEPKPATEPKPRTAAEVQADFDAYKAAQETTSKAMAEEIKTMRESNRKRAFSDEVFGRSEANPTRWVGEPDKHIATLMRFAEVYGEDSTELKEYVEQQRTLSKQYRELPQFKEIGSGSEGKPATTAMAEINQRAEAMVKEGKAKSFAEAVSEITATDKDLANRYYTETHRS